MILRPGLRKLALTAHVSSSVGWLGAAAAYLALAVAALTSQDAEMMRAAYLAMEPTAWFALVPLALASLLTGLVMSLGTTWGVFQHYWVLFKLLLTVLATIVLLGNMSTVGFLAGVAAEMDGADPGGLRGQILHAGGGLLILVVTTTLAVYKPRGMTPYGWRQQQEQAATGQGTGRGAVVRTPRWVNVFGIIGLVFILLIIVRLVLGHLTSHSPGGH